MPRLIARVAVVLEFLEFLEGPAKAGDLLANCLLDLRGVLLVAVHLNEAKGIGLEVAASVPLRY